MVPSLVAFSENLLPMAQNNLTTAPAQQRIISIDALRGLDMFLLTGGAGILLLLMQNSMDSALPESVVQQFRHAEWGAGFTCWDLVMPLFLFITGASMPFAFRGYRRKGGIHWRRGTCWRIARRVVLLFLLGMLVQGNLASAETEHMSLFCNTLQAIAEGYLISSIVLLCSPRLRWQLLVCACSLLLYWALLRFVPYQHQEAGLFQPRNNLAYYIDCHLQGHWQDGTPYTWILTSLAFGAITLMGSMGGTILQNRQGSNALLLLSGSGVLCLLAAWGLEKDTPLIKHLFTTTMVLWSGGWCLLLLALFHLLFDCCTYLHWLAYPLQVIGCNALLAYLLAEVHGPHGHNLWWGIAHPLFYGVSRLCGEEHAPLLFALCSYGLFWVVLHFLYKHKAFLRV